MAPKKLEIPIEVRYTKLLQEYHQTLKELEQVKLRNRELEKESAYPEHLRVDRLEAENKKLQGRKRSRAKKNV